MSEAQVSGGGVAVAVAMDPETERWHVLLLYDNGRRFVSKRDCATRNEAVREAHAWVLRHYSLRSEQ